MVRVLKWMQIRLVPFLQLVERNRCFQIVTYPTVKIEQINIRMLQISVFFSLNHKRSQSHLNLMQHFYCKGMQLCLINQSGCCRVKNVCVCFFNGCMFGNIQESGTLLNRSRYILLGKLLGIQILTDGFCVTSVRITTADLFIYKFQIQKR